MKNEKDILLTVSSNTGNDTIHYRTDKPVIDGGRGNDTLIVSTPLGQNLWVDLLDPVDQTNLDRVTVKGFENIDASRMFGSSYITGNFGANILKAGKGSSVIFGGWGNDVIHGNRGTDDLSGGEGNDTIKGFDGSDIIDGGEGSDYIEGGNGHDKISGGESNDTIYGGAGRDLIDGGEGLDVIDAGGGDDMITGGESSDVIYGGAGNDYISGGEGADFIYGGNGKDTIRAGGAADTVLYDASDFLIDGGEGDDTLVVESRVGAINLARASDQIAGQGIVMDFEHVDARRATQALKMDGDKGNNTLLGGAYSDVMNGRSGNDALRGGGDADTLYGADGNDTLAGEGGNDRLYGSAGNDTYIFGRGEGVDRIYENNGPGDDTLIINAASHDQLWFSRSGKDLEIGVIGTNDTISVTRWFAGDDRQVETIHAADGWSLASTQMHALVDAMARMTPPPFGQTVLTEGQHTQLNPVLASSWRNTQNA